MIDLISERAGGRIVSFNDEFFAPASNLLDPGPAVANDEYTDRGKWMDGWETRRRREPGHDWCIVALGIPGRIERVEIDTSHFIGNYPEEFSLEACGVDDPGDSDWVEIIARTALRGDSRSSFDTDDRHRVTMVRLNIYPDGGVARLRVEGRPIPSIDQVCPDGPVDLAGAVVGGEVLGASDMHFSHPSNLLRPVPSAGMWDGWETKRRRDGGHDWVNVELGLPGVITGVEVDTTHFKGNAPGWVSIDLSDDGESWRTVIDQAPVGADQANRLVLSSPEHGSHLRLAIHPDGGVARLRVLGRAVPEAASRRRLDYLNSLFERPRAGFFRAACASNRWVTAMSERSGYETVDDVLGAADSAFDELDDDDWLEAFAGHPRIGERGDEVANREQAGTEGAASALLDQLAEVNHLYEEKFGFTYIVYASGKSAEEMLEIARERLTNDRQGEISMAAGEQRKITATRLKRQLCQEAG